MESQSSKWQARWQKQKAKSSVFKWKREAENELEKACSFKLSKATSSDVFPLEGHSSSITSLNCTTSRGPGIQIPVKDTVIQATMPTFTSF